MKCRAWFRGLLAMGWCLVAPWAGVALGDPIPGLYNTGVDDEANLLDAEQVDPHYTLIQSPDPEFSGPEVFTLLPGFPVGPWMAEGPDSRWIAPQASQEAGNAPGEYVYRTTFDLSGFDPQTASIEGQWSSDNGGVDILLNETSTGITQDGNFGQFFSFTIESGFVDGVNTLDFVVNNAGDAVNPTGLRVELSGTVVAPGTAPNIVTQPAGGTYAHGDTVALSVESEGSPPLSFQWRFNGEELTGETDSTLTLTDVTDADAGEYDVVVSNDAGSATSDPAVLAVLPSVPGLFNTGVDESGVPLPDESVDPHYVLTVNADTESQEAVVQDSTVFPIVDGPWVANNESSKWIGPRSNTGDAPAGVYVYEFTFDLSGFDPSTAVLRGLWAVDDSGAGTDIRLNGSSTGLSEAPFTALNPLLIANQEDVLFVSGVNTLEFQVQNGAVGPTGLRVDSLRVAAEPVPNAMAPILVVQPEDREVREGDQVTLRAVASGSPPVSYQWHHDGAPITDATGPFLTIDPVSLSDAGEYQVVVTNPFGNAESQTVVLTVNPSSELDLRMYTGLRIGGFVGGTYRVEYKDNADATEWQTLREITLPEDPFFFIDPDSAENPERVYQVQPVEE